MLAFNRKQILRILWLAALLALVACGSRPQVTVQRLAQYEALFDNQEGWTGGDGAYSVALGDETTLWLFGDTWVGRIRNGRHVNATIVNNSIAIQHGKNPARAAVTYYYGRRPDGAPAAFIRPADGRGWLWPYHGILTSNGLYLFLVQVDRTGPASGFGFKIIGSWLGHVSNPRDPPQQWCIRQRPIPWSRFSATGDIIFGSAVLEKGQFLYIYGTAEKITAGIHHKYMILARSTADALEDFGQWRFFTGSGWTSDFASIGLLCPNMANEYSVSFQSGLGKYIAVYSDQGFSQDIVARLAPAPTGPWGKAVVVYQCPEAAGPGPVFCYAAKGHPTLTTAPHALVITYVANAMDFEIIKNDARLDRPRFLQVTFAPVR